MSEIDSLERIAAISLGGRNVKKELQDCLDRRGMAVATPNSLKFRAKTVADHREILLLNVFKKFG